MEPGRSIEQELLKNSLKEVNVLDNGSITGIFIFSSDFPAFEGHFPGQPVLPAVVQLAAVRFLAGKHLDKKLVPVNIDRAKFKNPIGPDEPVEISIHLDRTDNDVILSFSITTDKGKASSGKIACQVDSR